MEYPTQEKPVTQKDLFDLEDRLTKKLASKEELNHQVSKLATKEELRQEVAKLATKEELRQEVAKLATKEELRQEVAKLATKEELKQEVAKLATREALEVVATQVLKNTNDIEAIKNELKVINYRLDRLEEKFDTKFNLVLDAVDKVFKELTNHRTERAAVDSALNRHVLRLEDHEQRIQKLEKMTA
ncbi:MAG: hypothetical protein ONB13_05530 [candidate division KSB1 bacterium]|nr:hypothetical protein [candidate division KSB1 bacterium]MDZ7336171.1 hypothetical protein [candidate division KSB1 bacterium]MDZ7357432.1 hypothetical protein [candidate division KSB1 bacterium]MDZ7376062.1 hypothetical protein [candidate division KSB1 bacterium]MDZ7401670.1 hypothetical protein [candidate division KSB1 bacterium]